MRIHMDDKDWWWIRWIASRIQENKDRKGIANPIAPKGYSDLQLHIMGVAGEVAIAKWLGLKIDSRIYRGGDGGDDLIGLSAQVKTRKRSGWDYALNAGESFLGTDYGFLVYRVDKRVYDIAGWCTREDFAKKRKVKNYGYGRRYVMEVSDMRKPEEFTQQGELL